jgi:hypothetical protein
VEGEDKEHEEEKEEHDQIGGHTKGGILSMACESIGERLMRLKRSQS